MPEAGWISCNGLDHCEVAWLTLQRHSLTEAAELIAPMVSTIADLCSKVLSHASAASGHNAIVLREYSNQLSYVQQVSLAGYQNICGWLQKVDKFVKRKQLEEQQEDEASRDVKRIC